MEINIETIKLVLLNKPISEIRDLLSRFAISSFDKNGNNILHYFLKSDLSLQENAGIITQLFIDFGININAKTQKMPQRTALQLAVMWRQKNVFDLLLKAGADVNLQDGDGNSPLLQAVMNYDGGDGYFIEALISKGANINLVNKYDVSPKILSDRIANYDSKKFFN